MLTGFATSTGTARYRDRFPELRDAGHFRRPANVPGAGELWLSSIGLGTYLGDADAATDTAYTESIASALRSGINVLDTAINYRHQRSERNIGVALQQLIASRELNRDEILVCTKAGYLAFDSTVPPDPRGYFTREYVETGVVDRIGDRRRYALHGSRISENQIERSRRNLGLEAIDVFYIHNPESQFAEVSREVFRARLREAFETLKQQVHVGRVRYYGIATWNALRAGESERDYINLYEVEALAREAWRHESSLPIRAVAIQSCDAGGFRPCEPSRRRWKEVARACGEPARYRRHGQRRALPGTPHKGDT